MLKKLRLRFILIIMAIVTVMLLAIVFTVVYSTRQNLEAESLRIMESIAADPMQLGTYTEHDSGDFPFFALQIGRHNEVIAISGGYFDLSDESILQDLLLRTFYSEASEGELPEYHLRYCRRMTWDSCTIAFADIRGEDKTVARVTRACALIGAASFLLFLIISILLQSSNSAGLSGTIGGGAEQLFGKKRSSGYDAILSKISTVTAILFIVISLVLVAIE